MVDNVQLSAGTADGAVIATDDITSVHYPINKLAFGVLDSATLVSASNGLPVTLVGTNNIATVTTVTTVSTVTAIGTSVTPGTSAAHLGKAEDAAHSSGDTGVMLLAVREATAADLSAGNTDGDYEPLEVDASGRLWVHVGATDGTTTISGTVTANAGSNLNTSALALESGGNLATVATLSRAEDSAHSSGHTGIMALAVREATATDLSAGNTDGDYEPLQVDATGRVWVHVGTVDGGTITTITNVVHVDDNSGNLSIDDGGNSITVDNGGTFAVQAAQSGTWTVQPGNTANSTPWLVTNTPATSGGWSVFNATSGDGSTALTNSAQGVKGSAGQLGGWYIYNPNASAAYVPIYNAASGSVTVGTTNPAMILTIPATSAANLELVNGIAFGTAISVAAATTAGGNGAPGTALEANFFYK